MFIWVRARRGRTTMTASPTPGTVFAEDFEVVRRLGAGGMGRVFLVQQLSTGRSRALKVMRAQLADDPELRKRFAQEARIGGQIESEHVVEVVGAGVDAKSGLPWLAMEHLEGEDLAAYVARRGPLPPGELLQILQQVCHALGAAHRAGIVHRDVKPENAFLARARRADATYTVKVLDFGLAKALAAVTHSGTLAVGSPLFMAPEQFKAGAVSPQTDVWALGLLAFYLLTGRHYQRSARFDQVDVRRLFLEAARGARTPASARARELGCPVALPGGFDWWFARSVARRPAERFANAAQAFEQLARAVAPAAARPTPRAESHPRPAPSRTHRALLLTGLAAVVGLLVLLGAVTTFAVLVGSL